MIDMKLAGVLLGAGVFGSAFGVLVFNLLRQVGQLDRIVSLAYVTFLGLVGGLMLNESLRAIVNTRRGRPAPLRRPGQHYWLHGLPLKTRFKRSRIYISVIPVVALGLGIADQRRHRHLACADRRHHGDRRHPPRGQQPIG
jgi:hypothetical protein